MQNCLADVRKKNWFWDYNYIFDSSLSSYAMLVRLYLARCANSERQAFPSLNTIAKHCKISRTTVKKAINELIEKGWLVKEVRMNEDGTYSSNLYFLCEPPLDDDGKTDGDNAKADESPSKLSSNTKQTDRSPDDLPCDVKQPNGSSDALPYVVRRPGVGRQTLPNKNHLTRLIEQESYSIDSNSNELESIHAPSTGACVSETPEEVITNLSENEPFGKDRIPTEDIIKKAPEQEINNSDKSRTPDEVVRISTEGGKRETPEDESPDADVEEGYNNYSPSGVLNASVSNKDLIALLGNELRRVIDPAQKAYAIAGRLYNLYDFPAAELAVSALVRRFEKGDAVENPIAYLFKVARIKKEELESGQKYDRFLEEEYRPFSEKYPEEHEKRLKEHRKYLVERKKRLELIRRMRTPPPDVPGFVSARNVLNFF